MPGMYITGNAHLVIKTNLLYELYVGKKTIILYNFAQLKNKKSYFILLYGLK